jgi:uncharacterized membrane protein
MAHDLQVNSYLVLKYVHVLSGAVLLGTGIGIAYFLFAAHLSRNIEALRVVGRHVILADWIFTATAVVVQPVSGVLMMMERGWSFTSPWFVATAVLYIAIGACWIPVVVLQYRIVRLARDAVSHAALGPRYYRALRLWTALGVPAFAMVLVLYALMIFKPGV